VGSEETKNQNCEPYQRSSYFISRLFPVTRLHPFSKIRDGIRKRVRILNNIYCVVRDELVLIRSPGFPSPIHFPELKVDFSWELGSWVFLVSQQCALLLLFGCWTDAWESLYSSLGMFQEFVNPSLKNIIRTETHDSLKLSSVIMYLMNWKVMGSHD
jgi:hypothetical protein